MKSRYPNFYSLTAALVMVASLVTAGCGGEDSNLTAIINNQKVSLPINGVDIVDRIVVFVQDVGAIIIGQNYYVDGGNIKASMTLNGQDQPISQGSFVILFNQLGVASGQTVSFDFQVLNSIAFLQGHAEGSV